MLRRITTLPISTSAGTSKLNMAPVLNRDGGLAREITNMYEKAIVYNAEDKDFALYLNGELCGFARSYQEGETTLNELVYDLLNREFSTAESTTEAA
jgi:glutamate mutase epsilon subunit